MVNASCDTYSLKDNPDASRMKELDKAVWGERRVLTERVGGRLGEQAEVSFLCGWGGERRVLPHSADQGSQTSRFGLC